MASAGLAGFITALSVVPALASPPAPETTAMRSVTSAAAQTAPAPVAPSAPASACAQVIVYVVRGSGEAPQPAKGEKRNPAESYSATWDAFDPVDPETGGSSISAGVEYAVKGGKPSVETKTKFLYDLVEKVHRRVGGQLRLSWAPVRYPAVPVASRIADLPLWLIDGYPNSVTAGIRELHQMLKRQWERCGTSTKYVLAGYSQGADVVNSYLRGKVITASSTFGIGTVRTYLGPTPEISKQIAAVSLIADPNHDPSDPESYTHLDDHLAHQQGLTGFRAPIPDPAGSVTDSICIRDDAVCGQGTKNPDLKKGGPIHSGAYQDARTHPVTCHVGEEVIAGESAIACMADRITWRLGVTNLVNEPPVEAGSAPGTTGRDVAFFIDTTGSMSDDIASAISFAESQADRITSLDGRVALVQYRDWEDSEPVEVVTPFTTDMSEFQAGLSTLYADGGGDDPEALLHALMTGFDDLEWRYGAAKAAVVLTDADYHEPDLVGGETLPQVERRSLEIDPVNVYPVVDDTSLYQDLAARTSGTVISQSGVDAEQALGEALDSIAERPIAVLDNGTYTAAAGRAVHFSAAASSAVTGSIVEYRWDTDGDGSTDETTTEPTLDHTYPPGYSGLMQVLVVDDLGRTSNASATVLVDAGASAAAPPRVPTASGMHAAADAAGDHVDLAVSWTASADAPQRWVVAVDGDPVDVVDGSATHSSVPIAYQPDDWRVSVTPMDGDGNYGPEFVARLDEVPPPVPWYRRLVVWGVALLAGFVGVLAARLLGRSRSAGGSGPIVTSGTR